MGMDQQDMHDMQQGFTMINDFASMANQLGHRPTNRADGVNEEYATMRELDAKGEAAKQQQRAKRQAGETRSVLEQERAKANATWGHSGLTMSGSKALVRDAQRIQDRRAEDDVLFEGEMAKRETLDKGKRSANMLRVNAGLDPSKSTLSLGSSIYKYGR